MTTVDESEVSSGPASIFQSDLPVETKLDRARMELLDLGCKTASDGDPSQHRRMSLITRANPQPRQGHRRTQNSSRKISSFRNEINALLVFERGVNVARYFTS